MAAKIKAWRQASWKASHYRCHLLPILLWRKRNGGGVRGGRIFTHTTPPHAAALRLPVWNACLPRAVILWMDGGLDEEEDLCLINYATYATTSHLQQPAPIFCATAPRHTCHFTIAIPTLTLRMATNDHAFCAPACTGKLLRATDALQRPPNAPIRFNRLRPSRFKLTLYRLATGADDNAFPNPHATD